MQISKEELEDLYSTFSSIGTLRDRLRAGGYDNVSILDEIIKLRADVEKLKAKQTPTSE
jgi:hypothetical protein